MSALPDDSREAFEASFYDHGDWEPDPSDILDEEERYERKRSLSCADGMCGATDCANCYPASFDAFCDDEPEPEPEP